MDASRRALMGAALALGIAPVAVASTKPSPMAARAAECDAAEQAFESVCWTVDRVEQEKMGRWPTADDHTAFRKIEERCADAFDALYDENPTSIPELLVKIDTMDRHHVDDIRALEIVHKDLIRMAEAN